MRHDHTLVFYDESGKAIEAYRRKNPDGSVGGWVAEDASIHPTAIIELDALVMPKASVGAGVRVRDGVTVPSGCFLN